MGRMFTAVAAASNLTSSFDMIEFYSATRSIVIHEIGAVQLTQTTDRKELNMTLLLKSGQTSGNQSDDALDVKPLLIGDNALSISTFAERQYIKASGGTIVTHYAWNWNVRYPFRHVFTPATRLILPPGRRATFELATAPPQVMALQAYCVVDFLNF